VIGGSSVGRRALVLLGLLACGPGADEGASARQHAAEVARGPVVATVGAAEIGLHDVEQAVRQTGLAPEKALERLVAEQLLGQHAAERGYGEGATLERELKKARARALLEHAVEGEITPASIPAEAVAARFAQLEKGLDRPDARLVSWLVLPKASSAPGPLSEVSEGEAALSRLAGLPLDALRAELVTLQQEAEERGVAARLEQQQVAVGSKLHEPALVQAIDALPEPGLVPKLVDTRRGALVVVVEQFLPARKATLADHEAKIREQLALEARVKRTRELLAELAARASVKYDEAALRKALADDSLLGNLP
jgi:hypothetical protein